LKEEARQLKEYKKGRYVWKSVGWGDEESQGTYRRSDQG